MTGKFALAVRRSTEPSRDPFTVFTIDVPTAIVFFGVDFYGVIYLKIPYRSWDDRHSQFALYGIPLCLAFIEVAT